MRYHRAVITRDGDHSPLNLESRWWTPGSAPISIQQGLCLGRPAAWSRSPGDASDRRYFRVRFAKAADRCVLALHAGPIDVDTLPFVSVARLMRAIPLPVPSILHVSNELGVLGPRRSRRRHAAGSSGRRVARPSTRRSTARRWTFIATLQQRGAALAVAEYPPYAIAFDVEKLTWELEFFVKHYLSPIAALSLDRRDRATRFASEWAGIVEELAAEPRVLCHRDYHSRNLMLHGGSLYIIDFQDARMGPDDLRFGVAAPRFVRGPDAVAGRRADRRISSR